MNGRVYDAEIGRFLSADPHVQDIDNLQAWNRYSYVLNNPLSYTDPSGFFFKSLFKAIGNFFKAVFSAVKSVFKALLKIPLLKQVVQIVACSVGPIACAATAAVFAAAAGGSLGDTLLAAATTLAQIGIWNAVGVALAPVKDALSGAAGAFAAAKGAVHGVGGGAISLAQGGNFLEGFAANSIGVFAGVASQGVFGRAGNGNLGGIIGRTASAAVAGGAAALAAGGKFANGALTAAFAHLYNAEGVRPGMGHNGGPPLDREPRWISKFMGRVFGPIGILFGSSTPAGLGSDRASTWGNPDKLEDHFSRHGPDFGSISAEGYAVQANDFLLRANQSGLPTRVDSFGTVRIYEPSTNTFGSYNATGTTRTFFKPKTGQQYWDKQPGELQ